MSELIEQFVAVTNCGDASTAQHFLESCEGDLDQAVSLYLETQGSGEAPQLPAAHGQAGQAGLDSFQQYPTGQPEFQDFPEDEELQRDQPFQPFGGPLAGHRAGQGLGYHQEPEQLPQLDQPIHGQHSAGPPDRPPSADADFDAAVAASLRESGAPAEPSHQLQVISNGLLS